MRRYRVNLGRLTKPFSELVYASDITVVDGVLKLKDRDGNTVAAYRPGHWSRVRVVGQ